MNSLTLGSFDGKRASLVTFIALLLIFGGLNLRLALPYLLTLFMGAILASLFRNRYSWLVGRKFPPWLAALTLILILIIGVLGPLVLFGILAVSQGVEFGKELSSQNDISLGSLNEMLVSFRPLRQLFGDPASVQQKISSLLQESGKKIATGVLAIAANVPGIALQIILVLVTCYFFLVDGEKFMNWWRDKIPLEANVRAQLLEAFRDASFSTIWSAMSGALVQAGLLVIGFLVTGVPAVFVAGGVAFVLAWLPIVGSIPVWLAGVGYLIVQKHYGYLAILLAIGVIAGIADNVVRPWVLKGRSDMNSLVGLIAIFGGIELFGIFGVFYGPILVATASALLEVWPSVARRFGIENPEPLEVS